MYNNIIRIYEVLHRWCITIIIVIIAHAEFTLHTFCLIFQSPRKSQIKAPNQRHIVARSRERQSCSVHCLWRDWEACHVSQDIKQVNYLDLSGRQTHQRFLLVKHCVMCDPLSPISRVKPTTTSRHPITRHSHVVCAVQRSNGTESHAVCRGHNLLVSWPVSGWTRHWPACSVGRRFSCRSSSRCWGRRS